MANTNTGRLLTVEGADGSGKTTIAKMLTGSGFGVYTKEPTDSVTGELIRQAITHETPKHYDLFLFLADRLHHLDREVRPMLERGETVICDRFSDSTIAYQSVGCSRSEREFIKHVVRHTGMEPDLTLLLDVDVDTALERCGDGDKHEQRDFLEAVRDNYLQLAEDNDRIKVVDATPPAPRVFANCIEVIYESSI